MQQVAHQSMEGLVEQKEEKDVNQRPGSDLPPTHHVVVGTWLLLPPGTCLYP